ncbi:Npun_F0813 family protein [Floridanema evergladense]|uniref:Npun_F0813 family protein n=1 Tax=Floridaenema evergladense BLCC-F167 TaxID=3153639 RepID=A0ABV4WYH0_9CYAN
MFILKRQDVEITSIQHPTKDQQIPILNYQGQTFRLVSVFRANQEEEAKAFWRDLTDNRGKACVLLEEPERYSVWGKIRLDQLGTDGAGDAKTTILIQACVLLLQAVSIDIEDILGNKQAGLFEKNLVEVFQQWRFPQTDSAAVVKNLLLIDPLSTNHLPPWEEHHLITLLRELHRLGKESFGNTNFVSRAMVALQDLPPPERTQFVGWLNQTPVVGKLWQ